MRQEFLIVLIVAAAAIAFGWRHYSTRFTRRIIYDHQKGLLYRDGAFVRLVGAGRYRIDKERTEIEVYDMRESMLSIPVQDVLTADKVNVKISLAGLYSIADPQALKSAADHYLGRLYTDAQLALRDLVATLTVDELLNRRTELDDRLLEAVRNKAADMGLTLLRLAVRDIVLPANLKRAYAGIVEAQKEAQRQLEKARGEQAVLRSLANSSKMYDSNPSLLQARIVQALADGKNTIVFNGDGKTITTGATQPD